MSSNNPVAGLANYPACDEASLVIDVSFSTPIHDDLLVNHWVFLMIFERRVFETASDAK